jgi:hypothetical protein
MSAPDFSPRDHILGRLSEIERDRADERSLSDTSYFEALVAEEQLLIEACVSGDLSDSELRDFGEQCKLRPELRERVVLERMTRNRASTPVPARSAWTRILMPLAASIAVVACGAALFLANALREHQRVAALRDHEWQSREISQRARIRELEALTHAPQPARNPAPQDVATNGLLSLVASIVVQPYSRGGDDSAEKRFTIPPGQGSIELRFNIETDTAFSEYRISLRQRNGQAGSVVATPRIVNGYRIVSAVVPGNFPNDEHFEASVFGIARGKPDQLVETYAFVLELQNDVGRKAK